MLTLAEIEALSGAIQNITVAGVLIVFLSLFVKGDIISRKTVEEIVTGIMAQIKQDMEERFDKLGDKIDKMGNRGW